MGGMDDKTPNAYEEAWDGLTQTGTDSVINGVGGNDLIRYDSPSFSGVTVHASLVMNSAAGYNGQYSDFGITVKPEMMEGLEMVMLLVKQRLLVLQLMTYDICKICLRSNYNWLSKSESDATAASNSDESETFGISYQVTMTSQYLTHSTMMVLGIMMRSTQVYQLHTLWAV